MSELAVILRPIKTHDSLDRFFRLESRKYGESLLAAIKDDADDLRYVNEEDFLFLDYFSIHIDKEMVGYVAIQEEVQDHLERIYITPRFRRKGVASSVIASLNIVDTVVASNNLSALKLFEKLGFNASPSKCTARNVVLHRGEEQDVAEDAMGEGLGEAVPGPG